MRISVVEPSKRFSGLIPLLAKFTPGCKIVHSGLGGIRSNETEGQCPVYKIGNISLYAIATGILKASSKNLAECKYRTSRKGVL